MPVFHRLGRLAGAAAIATILFAAPALAGEVTSYAEAKALAASRHVPVVIDFATEW